MNQDTILFCHEGGSCSEQMVAVDNYTKLRVISYSPAFQKGNIAIVFVGGLSTVLESFGNIIYHLTSDFPFHYIETRDHSSSQILGEGHFDIETSGLDIAAVLCKLELKESEYVLMGYSLGVTVIADGFRHLKVKPKQMIFMEPTPVFHYPKWTIKLAKATQGLKTMPLKIIAKWYIHNFIIDKNADAEMVLISAKAIDSCDPVKLKKTMVAIADYTLWDKLESIECPVLVIAATKDKFHVHDETLKMVSMLRNCSYIDLETNQRSHSIEAAEVIKENLKKMP